MSDHTEIYPKPPSTLTPINLAETFPANLAMLDNVGFDVTDYGVKGDGVTDDTALSALLTTIGSDKATIIFPKGTYKLSSNITIPANLTLWFLNGAMLSPDTGVTVTINGKIEAGLYQIFSGLGTIVGTIKNGTLYPQWWGAKGDGVTDDAPSINAAITCSQSAGQYLCNTVTLPPAHYLINTSINIPHGTETKRVTLFGYNATLRAGTAGMDMIKVIAQGSPASFLNLGETKIFGLRMEGAEVASRGIVIGRDGGTNIYGVDGLFKSLVQDVDIRGCTSACIEIADSRLWVIDNCTLTTDTVGACCLYLNSTNDINMADHWISNTQMSVTGANTANVCVKMRVTAIAGTSGLGGIHFTDCVLYGQAVNCQATNTNAGFRDIFFTSCPVDGLNTAAGFYGFYFSATAVGSGAVYIVNTWVNAQELGIYFKGLDGCQVNGGKISSTSAQAIALESCNECTVDNVKMYDVNTTNNGGGAVNLSLVGNRNKVRGCNIYNATGHSTVIILIGASQVKPIVTHNTTDAGTCVTNNVTGVEGTNFIVAGNLS